MSIIAYTCPECGEKMAAFSRELMEETLRLHFDADHETELAGFTDAGPVLAGVPIVQPTEEEAG